MYMYLYLYMYSMWVFMYMYMYMYMYVHVHVILVVFQVRSWHMLNWISLKKTDKINFIARHLHYLLWIESYLAYLPDLTC